MKQSKLFYLKYHETEDDRPLPEMELCAVDVNKNNIEEVIDEVEQDWEKHHSELKQWDKDLDRTESGRPWVPILERQLEILIYEGIIKEDQMIEAGLINE